MGVAILISDQIDFTSKLIGIGNGTAYSSKKKIYQDDIAILTYMYKIQSYLNL